jgi:hypothetical protein
LNTCIYCGSSSQGGETCSKCKNDISDSSPGEGPFQDEFLPCGFDSSELDSIDLGFSFEEGFSRPDWKQVWLRVQHRFGKEEWHDVYQELARKWLLQLKEDIGGSYRIHESAHFYLLCAEANRPAKKLLRYAEDALEKIEAYLGAADKTKVFGKKVILSFSEEDDYYQYISYFYREGEHNLSSGIFLTRGYAHIAFPLRDIFAARQLLIHELVHNCLFGRSIPLWLEEGLAQLAERAILNRGFLVNRETAEAHRAFWDEQRIQEFWSGLSFQRTGESNQLSYSLAAILVYILSQRAQNFREFIKRVERPDAGQNAALEVLDCCLGNALEGLLGQGDWRPNRKVIASHFEKKKQ